MKKKVILVFLIVIVILGICLGMLGLKIVKKEYHRRLDLQIKESHSDATSVLVLTYHHMLNKEDKDKYGKDNMYVVATEDFEEQLKYLKENDYNSISADDLYDFLQLKKELPEKSVLITFDDGYLSTYEYALPLLEKYEYNAVVFCIGKLLENTTSDFDPSILQYMGYDVINEIKNNHPILKIGAHSNEIHDNPISKYSYEEMYEDAILVKDKLDTDIYSYPGGHYDNKYLKSIKNAGYKMAFKYKPSSRTYVTDNVHAISRIEVDGNIDMKGFKELLG